MDLDDDELLATRLDTGAMTVENLLNYWHINYEIPLFEIDKVKDYINLLKREIKNEKNNKKGTNL